MARMNQRILLGCLLAVCCKGFLVQNGRVKTRQQHRHRPLRFLRYSSSMVGLRSTSPALSSSNDDSSFSTRHLTRHQQHKDVVIIGSGLAGLSAALYLSQIDPTRQVTIYEREPVQTKSDGKNVASFAAAGMLAPQSERLPKGDLLDLCLASRRMFPDFCALVESLAKQSGEEGEIYLTNDNGEKNSGMEPWDVGYVSTGGFLAPAFAGDSVATWAPPDESGTATWLDATQVRELEPYFHPKVIGGWWFPEDFSVDARRLTCSLRAACVAAGVQIFSGPQYEVTSLDLAERSCRGLWLKSGLYVRAKTVLVANGSWMRNLLPVPVEPHKGQSLSLRMPKDRPPILRRVLFAQDSYIVPKADGRLVIGATVEAGSFDANVTPAGLLHILSFALELVPALKDLPIEESWVGLRPTTPDKGPILGETPWENLLLAGGYWRNGVLLAPKTGLLLAKLISGQPMDAADKHMLQAFAWDRFTSKEGGARLAAASRYAASMHPVHRRSSGAGVSASVGTELGSYSSARAAKEERNRDRLALFGGDNGADDDLEKIFEEAALQGRQDAKSYVFDKTTDSKDTKSQDATPYEGSADAFTIGVSSEQPTVPSLDTEEQKTGNSNIESVEAAYQTIMANKSSQPDTDLNETELKERPDPGFRIYHVDEETGEEREVPPYTTPGEFLKMVQKEKAQSASSSSSTSMTKKEEGSQKENVEETTYDGYTTIQSAYKNQEEALESMRKARIQNRLDQDEIDESKIGARVQKINGAMSDSNSTQFNKASSEEVILDVESAYAQIMARKEEHNSEKYGHTDEDTEDERKDPGFRIYHVDEETGEEREVPPYTSPGEFLRSIANEKKAAAGKIETKKEANGIVDETTVLGSPSIESSPAADGYNESTLDGYTTIQNANSRASREDELQAMREARMKNRLGQSGVDESKLSGLDNAPYGE